MKSNVLPEVAQNVLILPVINTSLLSIQEPPRPQGPVVLRTVPNVESIVVQSLCERHRCQDLDDHYKWAMAKCAPLQVVWIGGCLVKDRKDGIYRDALLIKMSNYGKPCAFVSLWHGPEKPVVLTEFDEAEATTVQVRAEALCQ